MLAYTHEQLVRETQLLITEVALLADLVIGQGAGLRALNCDTESHFAQTHHPDDLTELDHFDIWHEVGRVEQYVRDQVWVATLPADIRNLAEVVERAFSPSVVAGFEEERSNHPEPDGIPAAHEEGAGDVVLGHFHRGILAELVALACARLKMDRGERLTMGEIARLIDVREPTVVTNAHRKNFRSTEEGGRRYAEAAEVLPWMLKNGYSPTNHGEQEVEATPGAARAGERSEFVFVPVASDQTWFSPGTASNGRFTIGRKGEERKFTNYFAALEELHRMKTPRWRRKNANGIPGIVTGKRFERVDRSAIERELASLGLPSASTRNEAADQDPIAND